MCIMLVMGERCGLNKTLSIVEWHMLAAAGKAPPVRILLNGASMQPLIRWNRDYVTLAQLKEFPVVGDIVLFCAPNTDRYVVHRVWEIKDGMIMTWGDNCDKPDGWFPPDAIWGKVVLIERGRKKIHPDPKKGMFWAKIWHQERNIHRLLNRYKCGIVRRIKKLKVRGAG